MTRRLRLRGAARARGQRGKREFFAPVLVMLAAAAIVPQVTSSTAWNLVAVVIVLGVAIALHRTIRRSS